MRRCGKCGRTEPEVSFISSSGEWCMNCVTRLRMEEADRRLQRAHPYHSINHENYNRPTQDESVGVKERRSRKKL